MLNEVRINRELKELIKYIKSQYMLNQLYHEIIMKTIDNFYIDEGVKNGKNERNKQ